MFIENDIAVSSGLISIFIDNIVSIGIAIYGIKRMEINNLHKKT